MAQGPLPRHGSRKASHAQVIQRSELRSQIELEA